MDIQAAIKKPWVKYGLVAVAGVAALIVVKRVSGAGSTAVAQVSDPNADALAAQYAQLQQGAANQASSQSYNLAMAQMNDQTQLAALQLQTGADITKTTNTNAAQVQLAQMSMAAQTHASDVAAQTSISLAGIQKDAAAQQVAGVVAMSNIQATNAAQIASMATTAATQQAALTAHTQEVLAQTAAGVAVTQSNNSANVAIVQSNNTSHTAETVSGNAASASNHASDNSLLGGLAGMAGSLMMAFL